MKKNKVEHIASTFAAKMSQRAQECMDKNNAEGWHIVSTNQLGAHMWLFFEKEV